MCATPGEVCSNMSGRKEPAMDCPSAEDYVKSTMSRLGIDVVTTGYWAHDMYEFVLFPMFPEWFMKWSMVKTMSQEREEIMKKAKKQ